MKLRCIEKYVKCNTVHLALLKKDASTRYNLARNINISEDIQLQLISSNYDSCYTKEYLAGNHRLSRLSKYAQMILDREFNYHYYIRSYLAINSNICEKIQLILVKDRHISVKRKLSKNPNISNKTRSILNSKAI